MSGKEWFVDRDLFDTDNTHSRFELDDLVDKQERIAMRKYLFDRSRIVDNWRRAHKR